MELKDNLMAIGLTSYESEAYAALVRWGILDANSLARNSGVPLPRIYSVLRGLEAKGFVLEKPGRPVMYRAVFPGTAVRKHVESQTEVLEEKERQIVREMSKIKGMHTEPSNSVWSVDGRRNVYAELERMIKSAKDHIYIIKTENGAIRLWKTHRHLCRKAVERGVKIRLIVPVTDQTAEYVRGLRKYMEVRHLDGSRINVRMVSYDCRQVMLFEPLPDDTEVCGDDTGILLGERYAKFMENLFDSIWSNLKNR
jgi:sugar-specific transcriptional regulator TrmB